MGLLGSSSGENLDIREWAREVAQMYGIPENIFLSLITQESGWNPNAMSKKGAKGLTQLTPVALKEIGLSVRDIEGSPLNQISAGGQFLKKQYDEMGSWPLALGLYNSGAGDIEKDDPRTMYFDESGQRHYVYNTPETREYVLGILDRAASQDPNDLFDRDKFSVPLKELTEQQQLDRIAALFPTVPNTRPEAKPSGANLMQILMGLDQPVRPQNRPSGLLSPMEQ
jgi:hypothetical protein